MGSKTQNNDIMSSLQLISAESVYDYSPNLSPAIPDQLWPKDVDSPFAMHERLQDKKQFRGTFAEQLSEIAGRVCYDSFGTGRDSEAYHAHILEVNHGSVYEHYNFTVNVNFPAERLDQVLFALINRPGVWTRLHSFNDDGTVDLRLTLNLRTAVEWYDWTLDSVVSVGSIHKAALGVGYRIRELVHNTIAPNIVVFGSRDLPMVDYDCVVTQVAPTHPEEKWITLLITGSRGLTHELVRHGDRTAMSQRSTRFVDESSSPWVVHPLIIDYLEEYQPVRAGNGELAEVPLDMLLKSNIKDAQKLYDELVARLQPWLANKLKATGLDDRAASFSARKQARGAARGFLGNALYTEIVFSASVAQWHRMLHQRASSFADAEIRLAFAAGVLPLLKASNYSDEFTAWSTYPAADGIGLVGERA